MQEYIVKVYEEGEDDCGVKEIWRDKKSNKFHRVGGPAVTYWNGYQVYYKNGMYHREDGPAVIWPNGSEEYWLEDERYTKKQFLKKTQKHKIIIDGKEIEISSESFESLKKSLNKSA